MKETVEGVIQAAKWSGWENEQLKRVIPILTITVLIKLKGEDTQVFPALFFSPELQTSGREKDRGNP